VRHEPHAAADADRGQTHCKEHIMRQRVHLLHLARFVLAGPVAPAAAIGRTRARSALVLAVSTLVVLSVAAASARASVVFSVRGAAGAGPARYDRVLVERFGPASARTVLVLVPGSSSGAGAFGFVGRDLVRRVRGLQVWAVERREHAFEDTSVIERGEKMGQTPHDGAPAGA